MVVGMVSGMRMNRVHNWGGWVIWVERRANGDRRNVMMIRHNDVENLNIAVDVQELSRL